MSGRLAKMRRTLRTSPNWAIYRAVKKGEQVLADPATSLPGQGKYWIRPAHPGKDWEQDSRGPYGVLATEYDIEFLN